MEAARTFYHDVGLGQSTPLDLSLRGSGLKRRLKTTALFSAALPENEEAQVVESIQGSRLWDREYLELQVIPSSLRREPSRSLVLLEEALDLRPGLRVLDAGCGGGRNAAYLVSKGCRVHAVDFSDAALAIARAAVQQSGPTTVSFVQADLALSFPFGSNSVDRLIDSYFFCHALLPASREHFEKEFRRVLTAEGLLFSVVFATDDEYYARFPVAEKEIGRLVVDPHNGIAKCLYTLPEAKKLFGSSFRLKHFQPFEFEDVALGEAVTRRTFVSIWQPS